MNIKNIYSNICIIDWNDNSIDEYKIKSFYDFCNIKKIILVNITVPKWIYKYFNTDKILTLSIKTKNKTNLLNNIFNRLKHLKYNRCLIIDTSEAIIANKGCKILWGNNHGHLLKINSINNLFWELREFDLKANWIFTDTYGLEPKILGNNITIGKCDDNYEIINLTEQINDKKIICNSPYSIYLNACRYLLDGNINQALLLFKKRLKLSYNKNIYLRCYLGISICYRINYENWDVVIDPLIKGLKIDNTHLEFIFFLLSWGLESNKEWECYNIIKENKVDIFQTNNNIHLLPIDTRITEYLVLYLYANINYIIGELTNVIQVVQILLLNEQLPNNIKIELYYLMNDSKQKLALNKQYNTQIEYTNNITPNILLNINKKKNIGILDNNKILIKKSGNYNINNNIYQTINNDFIYNYVIINKKNFTDIWLNNSNISIKLIDKLFIYHFPFKETLLVQTNKIAIYKLQNIDTSKLTINVHNINSITNNISQYTHIIYNACSENILDDISNILTLVYCGLYIMFIGDIKIFKLLYFYLGDIIQDFTNLNSIKISDILNKSITHPNRKTFQNKIKYLIGIDYLDSIFNNYILDKNIFNTIGFSYIFVVNNILNINFKNTINIDEQNWKKDIASYSFSKWCLVIRNNKYYNLSLIIMLKDFLNNFNNNYNDTDIIVILPTQDINFFRVKFLFKYYTFKFNDMDNLPDNYILLINNDSIVKHLIKKNINNINIKSLLF